MKILWDVSHQEFTIEDHYYFSILRRELELRNAEVLVLEKLDHISLRNADVLVLNYPEKEFSRDEADIIKKFVLSGGRVIIAGYYNNEDNVADTINTLTKHFGLLLNRDAVIDEKNNYQSDKFFVVTSKINTSKIALNKILFACSASVSISGNTHILVEGEDTAYSTSGYKSVMGARKMLGEGDIVLLGTCVFWDNYSIEKYDNKEFALGLLLREF